MDGFWIFYLVVGVPVSALACFGAYWLSGVGIREAGELDAAIHRLHNLEADE